MSDDLLERVDSLKILARRQKAKRDELNGQIKMLTEAFAKLGYSANEASKAIKKFADEIKVANTLLDKHLTKFEIKYKDELQKHNR